MPVFDIFGLKGGEPSSQDGDPEDAPQESPMKTQGGRGLWGAFLALDALLIVACLCALGWRILEARKSAEPPAVPMVRKAVTPKKAPEVVGPPVAAPAKPAVQEPAKAEAKKPEAKKPEPAKAEAKKPEPAKPEAKKPAAQQSPQGAVVSKHVSLEPPAAPGKAVPARFEYPDHSSKQVTLLSPFLNRSGGRGQMFKNSQGDWVRKVFLNPGQTYRFRFEVVDKGGKARITPWETLEVR